jgi:hypothetical protein
VAGLDGNTSALSVKEHYSVARLKAILLEQTGVPVLHQQLFCLGMESALDDQMTIGSVVAAANANEAEARCPDTNAVAGTLSLFMLLSADDRDQLSQFHEQMDGPNWVQSQGWGERGSGRAQLALCKWHGAEVHHRKLVRLSLSNNGLSGRCVRQSLTHSRTHALHARTRTHARTYCAYYSLVVSDGERGEQPFD